MLLLLAVPSDLLPQLVSKTLISDLCYFRFGGKGDVAFDQREGLRNQGTQRELQASLTLKTFGTGSTAISAGLLLPTFLPTNANIYLM